MSVKEQSVERIEVSREEIEQILQRAKLVLAAEDFVRVENIVRSFVHLSALLEQKGTTIQRLRKLLFGSKSEKLRDILPGGEKSKTKESAADTKSPDAGGSEEKGDEGSKDKEKPKGHGRNGAEAYKGAEQVHVQHPSLKPGDPCPEQRCKGSLYPFEPLIMVRVVGRAPLGAKVITVDQLRCNLCLKVFPACSPEEFGTEKYDETAASMIAIMNYGSGVPFYRLAGLQGSLGVPVPDATQWDVVERAAKLVAPAFEALIRQAAQGDVLHNDDTPMKILEYINKKKRKEREDGG